MYEDIAQSGLFVEQLSELEILEKYLWIKWISKSTIKLASFESDKPPPIDFTLIWVISPQCQKDDSYVKSFAACQALPSYTIPLINQLNI